MLRVEVVTVAQLFARGHLVPASVQRDYHWEKPQCSDLLSDLQRACLDEPAAASDDTAVRSILPAADPAGGEASKPDMEDDGPVDAAIDPGRGAARPARPSDYFLGTMVVRPLPSGTYQIFDGLQRCVTLQVLLSVQRDLLGAAPEADSMHRMLIADDGRARVALPGSDHSLLDEVQTRGRTLRQSRKQTSERGMRIRSATRFFAEELKRWDAARRARFTAHLLQRTKVVLIEVEDPLLARQIFIAVNTRGIRLDRVDLFKGQLADIAPDDETAEKVVRRFGEVALKAGSGIGDLLTSVDFVLRRRQQGPDCMAELIEHLEGAYPRSRIVDWLPQLDCYASAWQAIEKKLQSPTGPDSHPAIWKLGLFRWSQWRPLALAWYADYLMKSAATSSSVRTRSASTMRTRFDLLHRACMAITLAGYSERDRSRIFGRAISQWQNGRNVFTVSPGSDGKPGALTFSDRARLRIGETLRLPLQDDDVRLTLMRWIEASLWADGRIPDGLYKATVEHVLPQRPEPASRWLADFPDEDERFLLCHSIGNLGIMDYAQNKQLMNDDFTVKRPVLVDHAAKYRTLVDIASEPEWTRSAIETRAKRLIDLAWREMRLPPS
jgi:hypothetical protein